MKRSLLVLAAAAALAVPATATAQAHPGNTNRFCTLFDFINTVTISKCHGFDSGNLLNRDAGQLTDADETAALAALGYGDTTVVEKIDNTGGVTQFAFATQLYGWTAVGIHWGGGADLFKTTKGKQGAPDTYYPPYTTAYNGNGGGTAFYLFDAGTTGITANKIWFASYLQNGSSGATLYFTGQAPDDPGGPTEIVPEPATMTLLATGLAGMAAASRRRRKNA